MVGAIQYKPFSMQQSNWAYAKTTENTNLRDYAKSLATS